MIPYPVITAAIALGCGVVVAALGVLVLGRLRRRSVAASVSAVVVVAVVAATLSVIVAAQAMVISTADAPRLLVIVLVAGVVSLPCALWLGRRLAADSMWADEVRDRERQLEAGRRETIAWLSHDLRTPLAGLRAMTEALQDGVVTDPETVEDYHRRMLRETDRMAALVDDLFQLSRITAGSLRLHVEPVSLRDIVSDAVSAARAVATTREVDLSAEPAGLPAVLGSESELNRVVRNLLDNAIGYSPPGGTVRVDGGEQDGYGWVSVADSCGGIPDADLTQVFEPAFRGAAARTRHTGGGLGLAIARGLVVSHRGTISASNADGGCRFEVRIPLAPEPGSAA